MHVFSTNHMCVRGSSAVWGLGITGVLLPGLEAGLEGSRRVTVKACFSGCLMCRGQCALCPACDRLGRAAELRVCVCMHDFSRILVLPLARVLFAHLFHFRGNYQLITKVWGFSSFEIGNMQTMVAHIGCSFRKKLLEFNVDENLMFQLWVNASCVRLSAALSCQYL